MSGSSLSAAILLAVLVIASANTDEDLLSTRRLKPVEPRICPTGIGSENVHLPHEFDCTLFYHCSHGRKILKECAFGLEFNAILEVCDWPFSAKCTLGNSDSGSSGTPGSSTTETSPVTGGGSSTTTGSSTTEGEILIPTECPAEWEGDSVHIAHEFDCGLFYHCDFGEKVLKECPPGLAFNPALQVCDWPEFAGCSLGDGGDSGGSTPTSSTSSTSAAGSSTTESSAPSVSWTQSSAPSVSTTESSAPSVSTTESWVPSETTTEDSSSSIWTTESSVPSESTTESEIIIPTECPANNEGDSVHLAHGTDCNLFYQCDNGKKVLKQCAAGLHFNPVLQVCDWPESAGCSHGGSGGSGGSTTESSGSGSSTTSSSTDSGNGGDDATVIVPTECPDEFDDNNVHIAHESDCGLFYQCVHGEKVEKKCPAGLAFNPVLQVCDWPESAGCTLDGSDATTSNAISSSSTTEGSGTTDSGSGTWTTGSSGSGSSNSNSWTSESSHTTGSGSGTWTTGSSGSSSSDSGSWTSGNSQTTSSGSGTWTTGSSGSGGITTTDSGSGITVPTKCPANFEDENVHLAHESDCGLFYQCVHGEKVERECPDGLHFNAVLQVCDWPESAGCNPDWSGGSGGSTSAGSTTESSSSGGSGSGSGTTESGANPPTECSADFEADNVHLPHESDCSLFYQCVHGEKVQKECPPGLAFNPTLQVCDWPESAGCNLGGSGSGDSDDGTTDSTDTEWGSGSDATSPPDSSEWNSEEWEDGDEDDTTAGQPDDDTTEPGIVIPTECPAEFEGDSVHIAHESDCGLFYHCVHGNKVVRECPAGLHFNPVLQVCDWPESAGCSHGGSGGSGGSTTESSGSGSSTTSSSTDSGNGDEDATVIVPTKCPEEFDDNNVHIAHESDCGSFYQCVHGEKVEKKCPAGLAFNPVLQVCDWPESAGCTLDGSDATTSNAISSSSTTEGSGTTDSGSGIWTTGSSGSGSSNSNSWTSESSHTTGSGSGTWTTESSGSSSSDSGSWSSGNSQTTGSGSGTWTTGSSASSSTIDPDSGITSTVPTECPADFEDANTHIAHESECGLFYHCVHGEKVERECPAGLHFNPVLQVCDWPESAKCSLTGSGGSLPGGSGSGSSTTSSPGSGSGTTESGVTVIPPTECPINDFEDDSVHIAHETNCSIFYHCVHGEKVERQCPSGLHFNPVLQVCDWPESASCVSSGSTTPAGSSEWESGEWTDSPGDDSGSTDSPNDSSEGGSGSNGDDSDGGSGSDSGSGSGSSEIIPPTKCPEDFEDDNTHIAHETECYLFYQCVHGHKVPVKCPNGLHFNPILQVCDWPESANCTLPGTGGSGPGDSSTDSPGSGSGTTEPGVTVIPPTECPIDDSNGDSVHIAHETDCSIFYHCVNGEKVERKCPKGLHFNPVLQVCDWPESAGCVSSGSTTPAGSSEWESGEWTDSPGDDSGSTDSPNDSSEGGSGSNGDDSDGGSGSDSGSGSGSSEIIPPTKCPEDFEDDNTHIAHETECYLFYQCVHGHKIPVKCPNGLHFNPVLQVCDWPESANCTLPGTGGSGPGDSSTDSPGSGSGTTEPGVTVIPPTECPIDDSNGDSVHIADPNNCGIFYHCVNGEKVEKSCPEGLHFNPVLQVCDWPESAGCESSSGSSDSSEWNDDSSDESGNSSNGSTTESDWQTTIYPDRENCVYPELCPIDDPLEYTIILPHRDCKKFCKCSNGDPYVYDCPKGLIFNRKLRVCDWTDATECPDYEE